MQFEEWRPVRGYEGLYEVSSIGRVKSLPRRTTRGGILKTPAKAPAGVYYRISTLCMNNKIKVFKVHALVLEAFVCPRPEGGEVRHLDGDSLNNYVENLTWGSRSQNMLDKVAHGTHHEANKTHCPRGHEYSPENTWVSPSLGHRSCRACRRLRRRTVGR